MWKVTCMLKVWSRKLCAMYLNFIEVMNQLLVVEENYFALYCEVYVKIYLQQDISLFKKIEY